MGSKTIDPPSRSGKGGRGVRLEPPAEPRGRQECRCDMASQLEQYTTDHRYLLDAVRQKAGIADPVAVELDEFYVPLLKAARRGELLSLDGVLVRDWDPDNRRISPGFQLGLR